MSLQSIFWIFLKLIILFEISLDMKFFLQNYLLIWRYKGVKEKIKTKATKKIIFDFLPN